jgi:hypothetical protein
MATARRKERLASMEDAKAMKALISTPSSNLV